MSDNDHGDVGNFVEDERHLLTLMHAADLNTHSW